MLEGGFGLSEEKKKKNGSRFIWLFVFICLAAATIYIITQNQEFSGETFINKLLSANRYWLACAFLCMAGFVVFEGLALRYLEKFFNCKKSVGKNTIYSAVDIYFSAITPSATGGQPAAGVFMVKDGIPAATTTLCLLINVSVYMASIVIIGLVCLIFRPSVLAYFSTASRVLIYAGFFVQALIVAFVALMATKEKTILSIADFFLRLLKKMHLMKNIESKRQYLVGLSNEYRECIKALKGHGKVLLVTLGFNILQRLSNIGVSVFVFLAVGGAPAKVIDAIATGSFVVLGSNAVPIPGAMGISDALFIDGFSELIGDTFCVELLSRGISFYVCLIICGLLTLYATLRNAIRTKKQKDS